MKIEIDSRLPSNIEAERSFLGASLIDHAVSIEAPGLIRESDLFLYQHQLIFRGMLHLNAHGISG